MKLLLSLLLMLPLLAHSLEVDEKLTVRIVKTSESRKTLMINRGTEDGLVEGDHARFLVTAGIVARAVLVKVSPTRSVWSVYRLVNADFIVNDAVMTLKITPPVKITKDETQAIVEEDTPTRPSDATNIGIPLAEGAQDLTATPGDEKIDESELRGLEEVTIVERNIEVIGNLNISGLTASTKATDVGTFKDSQSSHHIGLGAELYPQKEREWYSRFSLMAGLNVMRNNSQSYSGESVQNDATEFEFGANFHPGTMPSATHQFIPYLHLSATLGTVKSKYRTGAQNAAVDREDFSANGTSNGFSLGVGLKFYTHSGFGARMLLDYYTRAENYKADNNVTPLEFDKRVSGPRLIMGLSYRF